jgi:uncharacterized Tic20 family protein
VGVLLPLIIYLVKKDESPRVSHHAKEALNFHISSNHSGAPALF